MRTVPAGNLNKKHLKKATRMINKLFKKDKEFNVDEVEHYALPIDSVLEPVKNQVVDFVNSLRGTNTTSEGCNIQ